MSYEGSSRSYVRDYALIQGITLLENAIKRLEVQDTKLETISDEWVKKIVPTIKSQVQMIISTSADDVASKFLVEKLSVLNDHVLSEFPYLPYVNRLVREVFDAMLRAIQARSHIWNKVQLRSILTALGSSHVVKTKGLPLYDYEKEDKEDKKKKVNVLEYRPS
ncbi:hypothetical protein LCGC14_2995250 [marine sediment metagenome]|uniref:Uncharacterized protein n=1 Tax=marine sediment metagenome TaxID=412755 RepID=A0A0F8X369_9ZZZZ